MTMLSAHFSLEELTATQQRGLDNIPGPEQIENLKSLCETLEEIRFLLGPIHINSGFRSPEVNAAVGGQPTSQHCQGLAADFIVPRVGLPEIVRRIRLQHINVDQLIYEFGSWIHVSCAPIGRLARNEFLMVGKWTEGKYLPLDLAVVPS